MITITAQYDHNGALGPRYRGHTGRTKANFQYRNPFCLPLKQCEQLGEGRDTFSPNTTALAHDTASRH